MTSALPKNTWSDADYEVMGWHDAGIHAIAFDGREPWERRLLLDIDYIFEWIKGEEPPHSFSFKVAPATLVFTEVSELSGEHFRFNDDMPDIQDITRLDPPPAARPQDWSSYGQPPPRPRKAGHYLWKIDADIPMSFMASGYNQYIRKAPQHIARQRLTLEERGGLSFDERGFGGA
jgi:hypothetical protein